MTICGSVEASLGLLEWVTLLLRPTKSENIMPAICRTLFVIVLLVFPVESASADSKLISKSTKGNPNIHAIDTLSFGPGGVLLIGEGAGARIVAIETHHQKQKPFTGKIESLSKKIAERLGTNENGVEILDLAVNPDTQSVFIAVRKQDDRSIILVIADDDQKLQEFELDNVNFASVKLTAGDARISRVTDVAWAGGQIVAAGRSNESFASKIFSLRTPLEHDASTGSFSAETYHVSHRRWETKAPMSVVIPFREDGQDYIVGAFSCTPVVKYPIGDLKPGAKIKGSSVLELGSGNRPIDMFLYEKDGKNYVLSNTFRFHHARRPFGPSPYWTVKFEQDILAEDDEVNETALRRLKGNDPATDQVEMVESFHGVMQMDKLNKTHAVALRQTESGVNLESLLLP